DERAGADGAGYVGRFRVFGHGDCWGDEGHCELPKGPAHEFDARGLHPLTPIDIAVDCTDALRKVEGDAVKVTTLAFSSDPKAAGDLLRFSGLSLVTYD